MLAYIACAAVGQLMPMSTSVPACGFIVQFWSYGASLQSESGAYNHSWTLLAHPERLG